MENLSPRNIEIRHMDSFELRQTLELKDKRIESLQQKIKQKEDELTKVNGWNIRWQKLRWNEELSKECAKEIANESILAEPEMKILSYLISKEKIKAKRHVRGIARQLNMNSSTCCKYLKRLQKRKLIKAWYNGNKKNYHTHPHAKLFIEESQKKLSRILKK